MNWKIPVAVAAALAVTVAGALYYVAGTPQYSLYLIRNAVREGDTATFYQHFDVASVVSRTIDRAVGGIPAGPQIVSKKATDALIPAADKVIRERIDERLADPGSAQVLAMTLDSVTYRNAAALVTLKDPSDGSTTVITMLQLPNRHWKIVDVDLGRANIAFTLADARKRAEEETPQFPNMAGGITSAPPTPYGAP